MPATGIKTTMIFDHARVLDWQDVPATAWNALALALGPGAANPFYTRDAVAACVDLPTAQRPRLLLADALPVATKCVGGVALRVEN